MARSDVTYSLRRSTADITGICVHVTNTAAVVVFLQNSACNCTEEVYSVHAITIPGRHSQGSPFPVYTTPKVSNLILILSLPLNLTLTLAVADLESGESYEWRPPGMGARYRNKHICMTLVLSVQIIHPYKLILDKVHKIPTSCIKKQHVFLDFCKI